MTTEHTTDQPPTSDDTIPRATDGDAVADPMQMDDLQSLRTDLRQLREQFLDTEQRIASYLRRRPPSDSADGPGDDDVQSILDRLATVADSVDEIKQLVQQPKGPAANEDVSSDEVLRKALADVHDQQLRVAKGIVKAINEKFDTLAQRVETIGEDVVESTREVTNHFEPMTESACDLDEDAATASDLAWTEVVFGADLADDPDLAIHMEQLRQRLLAGDAAVTSLAGHLMVFGAAAPERQPQLLKDLGEAYYRCCPKTTDDEDAFETALAESLQRRCEKSGFYNKIELVRPGEPFEASRHSPVGGKGGGVVVSTLGWVVLRDNGKVYTKASISVQ